jgi:hypothetical protein
VKCNGNAMHFKIGNNNYAWIRLDWVGLGWIQGRSQEVEGKAGREGRRKRI